MAELGDDMSLFTEFVQWNRLRDQTESRRPTTVDSGEAGKELELMTTSQTAIEDTSSGESQATVQVQLPSPDDYFSSNKKSNSAKKCLRVSI